MKCTCYQNHDQSTVTAILRKNIFWPTNWTTDGVPTDCLSNVCDAFRRKLSFKTKVVINDK